MGKKERGATEGGGGGRTHTGSLIVDHRQINSVQITCQPHRLKSWEKGEGEKGRKRGEKEGKSLRNKKEVSFHQRLAAEPNPKNKT